MNHDGLVQAAAARLLTVPAVPPPLFAASLTPPSARNAASWADGLITVGGAPGPVRNWRVNALPPSLVEDLPTPESFDRATREMTAEDLAGSVLMSDDPGALAEQLCRLGEVGVDRLLIHHVGPDQHAFVERLGPALFGS